MNKLDEHDYWVPEHVRDYLRTLGFHLPLEAMEEHIRSWHGWMQATGRFYDYRDQDGFGRVYEVHRRSIHPAMRVSREWGALLLNEKTSVVCESQECTEWLESYFARTGFFSAAQATVVRAFGMGTGAWALWIDPDAGNVRIRRYDARMIVPLSWDEEGVTECAFVTRAFYRGKAVDQLQLHLRVEGDGGGCCGGGSFSPSLSSPSHSLLSAVSALSPSLSAPSPSSPSLSPSPFSPLPFSSLRASSDGLGFGSAPSQSAYIRALLAQAAESRDEFLKELETLQLPAEWTPEQRAAFMSWIMKGVSGFYPWLEAAPSQAFSEMGRCGEASSASSKACSPSKSSAPSASSPEHSKGKAGNGMSVSQSSSSSKSSRGSEAGSAGNVAASSKSSAVGGNGMAGSGAALSKSSSGKGRGKAGASSSLSSAAASVSYRIVTVCFDEEGRIIEPEGVCAEYDTGCPYPTFAIVKPAIENTRVDMTPYGQSIFADAIDAVQAVDLAFDSMINELDVGKMRIFLSDVLFDQERDGKKRVAIPFGRQDCTVFRKVMSTEDTIQEFAPALRTSAQVEALRIALQTLGDLCGLGLTYFDFDSTGYVKTATEVASEQQALMRNVARHEHALEQSIVGISRALLWIARGFGVALPDEGDMRVDYDDSIITDKYQEKKQDLAEVGVTMSVAEFRAKWYSESEDIAQERAAAVLAEAVGFSKNASE